MVCSLFQKINSNFWWAWRWIQEQPWAVLGKFESKLISNILLLKWLYLKKCHSLTCEEFSVLTASLSLSLSLITLLLSFPLRQSGGYGGLSGTYGGWAEVDEWAWWWSSWVRGLGVLTVGEVSLWEGLCLFVGFVYKKGEIPYNCFKCNKRYKLKTIYQTKNLFKLCFKMWFENKMPNTIFFF